MAVTVEEPYQAKEWQVNEAITKSNINHMELGIAAASKRAVENSTSLSEINQKIGSNFTSSNTISSNIATLNTAVQNLSSLNLGALREEVEAGRGSQIRTLVEGVYKSFSSLSGHLAELDAIVNEVNDAHGTYLTLTERFSAISILLQSYESNLNAIMGSLNGVLQQINAATVENSDPYETLDLRLDAMTRETRTVASEVVNARGVNAETGEVNESLAIRLNAIDSAIESAIEAAEAAAATYTDQSIGDLGKKVDGVTDYANVKDYVDTLLSLGAYVNMPAYVTAAINTNNSELDVAEIIAAHRTDEDTLKDRFEAIEYILSHAAEGENPGGLSERLTAAEGTIENLSGELNNHDGIKNRLDAIEDALDTEDTGIKDRLSVVENDLNTENTGIKARLDAVEITANAAATSSRVETLEGKVRTLEETPVSYTEVIPSQYIVYDVDGIPTIYANPYNSQSEDNEEITPNEDTDYLLERNNKFYYWKYINNNWELISGGGTEGGGGGSSSGAFAATLESIVNPDENTDYFVGNNTIGYTHYRYVIDNEVGSFVKILPKGLLTNASVNSNGKPIITTLEDSETNVLNSFNALKSVNCTTTYDTDGITPKSYALAFTDINGQEYKWDLAAGGGGSAYAVQFINESGNLELYIPNNANSATVSARIYARLGTELLFQTGSIAVKYKAEFADEYTTARVISDVANNVVTNIDIIDLVGQNSTVNIQLTASIQPEDTPITRNITYTVHRVPMSIEPYNYDPAAVKTTNFDFQYYCIGSNLSKIVHFVIDGVDTTEDIGINANSDLLTKRISVSSLERGMHSLKVYFTVGSFSSNEVNTYFLYDDGSEENKPLIALSTDKSIIQDGENLNVNYTVYTKGFEQTEEVVLETYTIIEGTRTEYETKSYQNVNNGVEHTIAITNYPSSGIFYMTMRAMHTVDNIEYTDSKTISITITEYQSDYDTQMIRAGATNMIYEYEAAGRTNNDSDKTAYEYTYTDVSGSSKDFIGANTGFNWASNGYTNGESLVISGGAVHTIDIPLFLSSIDGVSLETDTNNNDILKNGRTFEIDYEVNSATNLNAEIASFGNGLKITPSVSYLVPQGTSVTVNSHGLIEKEDEICAAYLATEKRMHMVFVIEPKSTTPTSQGEYHQCVNIYINGEFVNSCSYTLSDSFSTNSTFTIGSNTCIIKLYSVRMYNRGLTNDEVLRNYMMAPITKIARINRFAANDVLDTNKLVDYNKARNKFNCLLITGEISPYKKKTKTPSGITLTKPDFENLTYTTEFNLLDKKEDGTYYSSNNVQGTSSQTYPIHNLKVYLAKEQTTTEVNAETGEEETVKSAKKVKYSLKGENGIAESTLCWKADYMSTDHANTLNANFANNLFTDKLPSQVADPKVQNTVYGIRCLLFQRNDEQSTPVFIADGCLNNDKGNNSAFGLSLNEDSGNDTTRQKWEFTNNSSALDFFQADGLLAISNGDYYAKTAFESTYPDEGDLEDLTPSQNPNYNHLQVLMTWVHQRANYWDASTAEGTGGTYNEISYSTERELKKAIFISEFQRHFNLNHILTYHLFSEFIALCDNRAKNMFLRCDNVKTEVVYKLSDPDTPIFEGNSNPNASFFEDTTNIGTEDDPIYAFTHADQIDWENSTFAIWYPVLYDLDSCYGVENVGRITIPYDAEWDYSYNGKNQFSGVESRLWLMVEDSFESELKTLAQNLYPNSLNYNTFYNTQIQAMADSTCPAVTNQDMLLKYNAYWADGFIDYSLPNNPHVYRDYKYIQRGSRAYQKDTFIKLRANYLSSKYVTSNFMNDQIRFRSSVIIPVSNSDITLTTNQTLYPAITYGDNKDPIRSTMKIAPGDSVTLYASDQVGNTDTIHIGGASALTDIGDISKFEPYNLDVSGGVNLKNLVVGSNVVNASTNKIDGLGSCALLETINVRNCTNFSGTLNLRGNGLIRNVYAAGSGITNIELPEGGNLTNIEYGAATTMIKIINHGSLQNFTYENAENNHYANVTRLHVENTPNVPVVDIINNAISHLTGGIRLAGININLFENASTEQEIQDALEETTTFLNILVSDLVNNKYIDSAGVYIANSTEQPHITGTVHITSIRRSLLNKLNNLYSGLTIIPTEVIEEYPIIYKNVDGNGVETTLLTLYRTSSEAIPDPIMDTDEITNKYYIQEAPADQIAYDGIQWVPVREADAQYIYRFGTYDLDGSYEHYSGWKKKDDPSADLNAITLSGELTLVATYPEISRITRKYTVTWYDYDRTTIIKQNGNLAYGADATSFAPDKTNMSTKKQVNGSYKVFIGWDKPVNKIVGDTNVYSQWDEFNGGLSSITNLNDLSYGAWYYLTQLRPQQRTNLLDDHLGADTFNVQLGRDFDFSDYITTYDLLNGSTMAYFSGARNQVRIYDGTDAHESQEIYPLADLTQDFTLALDYKFLLDSTQWSYNIGEYVLASCFQYSNSTMNGFKLSLFKDSESLPSIKVTWGSNSISALIDYAKIEANQYYDSQTAYRTYRNMIVLRHNGSEPDKLYVYYPTPSTDPSYYNNSGITYATLTWSSYIPVNNPLVLGGNFAGTTSDIEVGTGSAARRPAKGLIYYAKYWRGDIGHRNCQDLAIWPHETVAYKIMGYANDAEAGSSDSTLCITNNNNSITINFVPAQVIGDRSYNFGTTGDTAFRTVMVDSKYLLSWSSSQIREFCNDRIYKALPIGYQSLLEVAQITSNSTSSNTNGNVRPDDDFAYDTEDYIYLPSYREVETNISNLNWKREAIQPWPWLDTNNSIANLFTLDGDELVPEENSSLNFLRFYFFTVPVLSTAKIIHTTTNPANRNLVYNGESITIQPGDIWYNNNMAYIFVTPSQITYGAYIDPSVTPTSNNGGWMPASIWALRSYDTSFSGTYKQARYFYKVLRNGQVDIANYTGSYNIRGLVPEFSI